MGITDQLLMAYVDGELSPDLAALILSRLESEPDLLDRMEQQQELRRQLSAAYGSAMAEPLPPGLTSLLSRESMAAAAAELRRTAPRPSTLNRVQNAWPVWAAAAAAALVGVGVSEGRHMGDTISRSSDGRLLASGALARSLENSLAAEKGDAGPKIMASFKDRAGRFCRVFQGSGHEDGVACKDAGRWQVAALATSAATAPGEGYRQASSVLAPSVAAAVDELQGAVALTPEQERLARIQQWQVRAKAGAKSD